MISWLDGNIGDGEKIRRIERLVTVFNNNEEHHIWGSVKTDSDCRIMMHGLDEIVMMVVIIQICCLVILFICRVVVKLL